MSFEYKKKELLGCSNTFKKKDGKKDEYIWSLEEAKKKCNEDESCTALYDWKCDGNGFARCKDNDYYHTSDSLKGSNKRSCVYVKHKPLNKKLKYEYVKKSNKACVYKKIFPVWKEMPGKRCKDVYLGSNGKIEKKAGDKWWKTSDQEKCLKTADCTGIYRHSGGCDTSSGWARCKSDKLVDNKTIIYSKKTSGKCSNKITKDECAKHPKYVGIYGTDGESGRKKWGKHRAAHGCITYNNDVYWNAESKKNKERSCGSVDLDCLCKNKVPCVNVLTSDSEYIYRRTKAEEICNADPTCTGIADYGKDGAGFTTCTGTKKYDNPKWDTYIKVVKKNEPGDECLNDNDCKSNSCLGGVCCNSKMESCKKCSDKNSVNPGTCAKCENGFETNRNGKCTVKKVLKNRGDECSDSKDCKSGQCLGGICCHKKFNNCSACANEETNPGNAGTCWNCKKGFDFLQNWKCGVRKELGEICTGDKQGKSRDCKSGKCLKKCCKNIISKNCLECDDDGMCKICKDGFKLKLGLCIDNKKLERIKDIVKDSKKNIKEIEQKNNEKIKDAEEDEEEEISNAKKEADDDIEKINKEKEKEKDKIKEEIEEKEKEIKNEAEDKKKQNEQKKETEIKEIDNEVDNEINKVKKDAEEKKKNTNDNDEKNKIDLEKNKKINSLNSKRNNDKVELEKKTNNKNKDVDKQKKSRLNNLKDQKEKKNKEISKKTDKKINNVKNKKKMKIQKAKKNTEKVKKKIEEKKEKLNLFNKIIKQATSKKNIVITIIVGVLFVGIILFIAFSAGKSKGIGSELDIGANNIEGSYAF